MKTVIRPCLLALGFAGALLAATPIWADPVTVDSKTLVTAPNWVVGSNWYYSDGYALKVTSATPGSTVFDRVDAPGQWFSRQGFLRKDLTSGTATRTSIFRTIPDQAGMSLRAGTPLTFQREYLENGALVVHASSWSVEGRETITVPAGTFDCFVIVWRTRSLRSDWTGFERWWYSPQAQNYVRMEYKYGPDTEGSRVLMRYQIGVHAAENAPSASSAELPDTGKPVMSASVPHSTDPANSGNAAPTQPVLAASVPQILTPALASNGANDARPAQQEPALQNPAPTSQKVTEQDRPAAETTAAAALPKRAAARPTKEPTAEKPAAAYMQKADVLGQPALPGALVWHAQIASSKEETAIHKSLDKVLRSHANLLKGIPSGITAATVGERGVFYRAWLGEFDRSSDAIHLCDFLRAEGAACSASKSARGGVQKLASK